MSPWYAIITCASRRLAGRQPEGGGLHVGQERLERISADDRAHRLAVHLVLPAERDDDVTLLVLRLPTE